MAKLLCLAILLILVSCQNTDQCKTSSVQKASGLEKSQEAQSPQLQTSCSGDPDTAPDPEVIEQVQVPVEASMFEAQITFVNFGRDQEEKVHQAVEIIKNVIKSKEFKYYVTNYTYQGRKQFNDNKGLSNEEIYQILLNGSEELRPDQDFEMDLELELYYSSRNTVGYTNPDTMRIWMNTKYFDVFRPHEVAGNVFHEWTHKLGFDHATTYSEARDHSVPYAVGYLIRDLGKKYEQGTLR